jgi:DNA-binding XRE family transcriptional regulator
MMKNIIYGLRDPRNDVYQYIGKSTVGEQRPLQHLTRSHSPYVNEWVKTLEDNWLYLKIDIIEEVEDLDSLAIREKYWIGYYHDINPSLLNIQLLPDEIVETRSDQDGKDFEELFRVISNIGSIVKKERIYRKITQSDMAKRMGTSRSSLVLLEQGRNVGMNILIKSVLALKEAEIKTKMLSQRVRYKE